MGKNATDLVDLLLKSDSWEYSRVKRDVTCVTHNLDSGLDQNWVM